MKRNIMLSNKQKQAEMSGEDPEKVFSLSFEVGIGHTFHLHVKHEL